ncbi:MAG: hypothetical protein QM690_06855 [Sphingobium sp.]
MIARNPWRNRAFKDSKQSIQSMGPVFEAEGRQTMNIQTSGDFPTRPADYIDRGARLVSRASGLVAFAVALVALLYLTAF